MVWAIYSNNESGDMWSFSLYILKLESMRFAGELVVSLRHREESRWVGFKMTPRFSSWETGRDGFVINWDKNEWEESRFEGNENSEVWF